MSGAGCPNGAGCGLIPIAWHFTVQPRTAQRWASLFGMLAEGASRDDPALIHHLDRNLNVTRITPSTAFF